VKQRIPGDRRVSTSSNQVVSSSGCFCYMPDTPATSTVPRHDSNTVDVAGDKGPITDEGVAFGSDTATGMMPMAHRVAGVLAFQ
jgi:hypothetical protein